MKRPTKALISILFLSLFTTFPNSTAANAIPKLLSVKVSGQTATLFATNSSLKGATYSYLLFKSDNLKKAIRTLSSKTSITNINNLEWFTKYSVKFKFTSNTSKQNWSGNYSFETSGPEFELPTVEKVTHSSFQINWVANPVYTSYQVVIGSKPYYVTTSTYVATGLEPGESYEISVTGLQGNKKGHTSDIYSVDTLDNGPTALTAIKKTNSITLSWNPIAGSSKYNIYRDSVLVGSSTSTTYEMLGLKQNTSYAVGVSAVFGVAETDQTSDKIQTLAVKAEKPTITDISSTFATVKWTANSEASKYLISIYDQTGLTPVSIGKSSGTYTVASGLTQLVLQGLSNAQIYTITLQYIYEDAVTGVVTKSAPSDFATFTSVKPIVSNITLLSTTSSSASISWSGADGVYQYEIYRDNVYLTYVEKNVNSYQVTGLIAGTTYKIGVKARYYDSNGILQTSEQSSVNATTAVDSTASPTIYSNPLVTLTSGVSPVIGMTLSASSGTWTSSTPISGYSYQWQRGVDTSSYINIEGATNSTYVVTSNDLSLYLRVRVTATNLNGSKTEPSSGTNVVIATGNLLLPVISGKPVVGEVLDTSDGVWNTSGVVTYTYQWYSGGSTISGATSSKFTVTSSEVATKITVIVTATTKNGSSTATSAPTAIVYLTGNTALPVITGTARVGNLLSTTTGTWLNSPTISYNWQRSVDGIAWVNTGGNASTYTITNDDAGNYLRVQVIGTKSTSVVAAESANTLSVPNLVVSNSARPVLSGSWTQGQTLTTSTGTWSSSGTFTYQWQRSEDASTWSDISGATSSSYTLTSSDASKYFRVQVVNTTSSGTGIAFSNATQKVDSPYNTAVPTISGTVQVGATQTVTTGTWSNSPTAYAYQWQSSSDGIAWTNIAGATSSTYAPTFSVANLQVRVSVSAGNAVDTATVTTVIVSSFLPPAATAIPGVSGTVQVGQTLTSDGGTWPGTSNSYRVFTWQRSADNGISWTSITGATSNTYVLVAADTGYLIRSQVSLTTNAGTASAYSLPTVAVAP